ncbi:MAG: acyltransferase family protein [Pseudomonadota bacterium]
MAQSSNTTQISGASGERRRDLDWLRVLAFGLLLFFHTAVLFKAQGIPDILNDEPSPALGAFVAFSHQFRLSLLFLVSGMGVRFALKRRSGPAYLRERSRRLLLPLLFGVAVVVPPMIYLEKHYDGQFSGSFSAFYAEYFTSGVYPAGHLSWHHYWFIAYLFLFCLLSWPLFRHWLSDAGRPRLAALVTRLAHGRRIYLVCLALIGVELALRPAFPGFRDLVSDWASFSHWFIVFVAGFVIASDTRLLDRCSELRRLSLALAATGSAVLFWRYFDYAASEFVVARELTLPNLVDFIAFSAVRMIAVWAWLLTCVGFAARYLNRPGAALDYLNAAVYPFFCLHLPLIVAAAYIVLPLDLPIPAKYLLIVAGAAASTLLLYEAVVLRIPLLGIVLGARTTTHEHRPQRARPASLHRS